MGFTRIMTAILTVLGVSLAGVACTPTPPPPPKDQITEIEGGINGDSFEVRTRDGGSVELFVRKGHSCVVNDIYTKCLKPGDVLIEDATGKVPVPRYNGGEMDEQEAPETEDSEF